MSEKEIPPEDKIALSPIDQYAIYGKFPYHLIIHIILIVFNTIEATIILSEFNEYFRAQEKSFITALISDDSKEKQDFAKLTYLYTIDDLQNHLNESVSNMLEANDTFFNTIIFVNEKDQEIDAEFIDMEVEYKFNISEINKDKYPMPIEKNYLISQDNLGPFNTTYDDDDIKNYIKIISKFEMTYNFKMYLAQYYKEHKECFIWKLKQKYDFSKNAHFVVSLEINNQQCEEITPLSKGEIIMISHLWVHFIVIFFAAISVIICLYNFYAIHKLKKYRQSLIVNQKGKKIKNPKVLKEIETIEKASYTWDILTVSGNLFQILGSSISLLKKDNLNYSINFYIATGVLFCYCSLGRYFDYDPKYALFFRSLSNTYSNLIPSFIAIIPIFIAFTLLGLCLFWNSERFTSAGDIVEGLIALFIGDSIHDIISDITDRDSFFGPIYGYLYTTISIIVIMNVFVAIIQSAFIKAKFEGNSNWIYNSLIKGGHEVTNENLKNLPSIEKMSPEEIIEEMEKRIKTMNDGLNKCINLIEDVENKRIDIETKTSYRKIIYRKIEEIDKKLEFIKFAWENE